MIRGEKPIEVIQKQEDYQTSNGPIILKTIIATLKIFIKVSKLFLNKYIKNKLNKLILKFEKTKNKSLGRNIASVRENLAGKCDRKRM